MRLIVFIEIYVISNYYPFQRMGGRLFEGWGLFNNLVSKVVAYSRVGAYSRGRLIEALR